MPNNSNQMIVPEAREAMNKFKMESAAEVGVTIKEGYNGDLTSRQAGSVGGQMVNIICPERNMKFKREYRWVKGHAREFTYKVYITA
ncbi:MAG: alpha/beta-type small acid-soluble spore protein [Firmicutes bacterium]|nr:alpha/beta-type small acid-soluble spore protein [Bacillota bacterium]